MNAFFHCAAAVAAVFYLVLLRRLILDRFRQFSALFVYVAVLFLTMAVDYAFVVTPRANPFGLAPHTIYYVDDLLRQVMLYVVVISLIYRAIPLASRFAQHRRWLIVSALAVAVLFFVIFRQRDLVRWMTIVVRNLSILAMLLNMGLWMLLFRSRSRDRTLMLVVSGLGLQVAGEAIGQSFRLVGVATIGLGNVILALSHLLCLWVWTRAIRPSRSARPTTEAH